MSKQPSAGVTRVTGNPSLTAKLKWKREQLLQPDILLNAAGLALPG